MTHSQTPVNGDQNLDSATLRAKTLRITSLEGVIAQLHQSDRSVREVNLAEVTWHDVADARPARTFRAYKGRKHYDGLWWSSTTRSLVGFESLHERAFLLTADSDPEVVHISSQPMALTGPDLVSERERVRIPDYLLAYADGSVELVDVSTPKRAMTDRVQEATGWLRHVCLLRGWRYRLWTGDDPVQLRTLRHAAGYRNPRLVAPEDLDIVLESIPAYGVSIRQLLSDLPPQVDRPRIIPAALHLAWHGHISLDWSTKLRLDTVLHARGADADEAVA
ncbi:hypothetical protein H483_0113610 [Dietzia sp. UCD-THP]|uniref:TnsA-like heteromeric transposase endonuclease subunit n=1 Tax=Dietzia sp. UCD-THP TaxID=1292020 RepID=UPI00035EC46C|nr:TnsA-like heteromeric transposase endonuclease subunit [Dietzia sp. UCD-THP]EYT60959.1 hypothetical protein H483_0113610 [Dietzia sp. UCD-THP]